MPLTPMAAAWTSPSTVPRSSITTESAITRPSTWPWISRRPGAEMSPTILRPGHEMRASAAGRHPAAPVRRSRGPAAEHGHGSFSPQRPSRGLSRHEAPEECVEASGPRNERPTRSALEAHLHPGQPQRADQLAQLLPRRDVGHATGFATPTSRRSRSVRPRGNSSRNTTRSLKPGAHAEADPLGEPRQRRLPCAAC